MIRLWWLMWYFTRPTRPKEGNAPSWYKDEISRSHLWFHLAHDKKFLEDWRSTIRNGYYFFSGTHSIKITEHGTRWVSFQKKLIDDLIDKAIYDGYLVVSRTSSTNPTSSEIFLTTNWKGRDFLKPIQFFNATLKEYGYVISFLIGIGGTLIGAYIKQLLRL